MDESGQITNPEGQFISVGGLKIHYRESGAGRPLILLHGATDTHFLWEPFLPKFAERYRVIAPDSRGHGRTLNPDQFLAYPQLAEDLAGLIRALELESPLIFGYSDGGQAALEFGVRYPNLAGALVLGGIWFQFSQEYQSALRKVGFLGPGEIDFQAFEKQAPQDWKDQLRSVHHDPRPDYPRILLSHLADLWWTPMIYTEYELNRLSVPTLIIMGENDEMIPWQETLEIVEKLPQAVFGLIPNAAHDEVIVPGGTFLDLALDFLDRLAS